MLVYHTSCTEIKKLVKEYGLDAFEWEVRRKFDEPKQSVEWEKKVLRRSKVLSNQDKWINGNIAGHILATPASRKKISDFHKGKPKSDEHKQKISQANKGKVKGPQTVEHRLKNSVANSGENNPMYGKPCSEERKDNISAAKKGKPNGCSGRVRSEESKQKQREKMLGRQLTPDQLARSIAKRTGMKRTQETKNKISKSLIGISRGPMTNSEKQKRSIANKGKAKPDGFGKHMVEVMKERFTNNNPNKREDLKKVCTYCNGNFGPSNYTRWHGDNCKMKGNV
jgi:hypothetical protein